MSLCIYHRLAVHLPSQNKDHPSALFFCNDYNVCMLVYDTDGHSDFVYKQRLFSFESNQLPPGEILSNGQETGRLFICFEVLFLFFSLFFSFFLFSFLSVFLSFFIPVFLSFFFLLSVLSSFLFPSFLFSSFLTAAEMHLIIAVKRDFEPSTLLSNSGRNAPDHLSLNHLPSCLSHSGRNAPDHCS